MQQLKLFSFLKVLLIFIISYILSCNHNLKNIGLLDNDVFIPILLTLLCISLTILTMFKTLIPLLVDSICNKHIDIERVLNSELKQNIVTQFICLAVAILFSLMEGTSFFYNFLKKHNLYIYSFCINNQSQITYFYKIFVLCISLSVVCDMLVGIFSMPKNKN